MNIYVDTSILSAYYCPECGSSQAQELLASQTGVAISWLTEIELVSAVSKKVRKQEINKKDAQRIIKCFTSHVDDSYYEMLAVTRDDYNVARKMITRFDTSLRTLDALHVAVTLREERTMATADNELAKAAKIHGINITYIDYK